MESILFVALSEKMARTATQVTAEMGLTLPIVISKAQEANGLAQQYPQVDVMISRGGTAEVLSKIPGKAVVEITSTISDFLEPIHRIVTAGPHKIGVVAHTALVDNRDNLMISNVEVFIRPWHEEKEIRQIIDQLSREGVEGLSAAEMLLK